MSKPTSQQTAKSTVPGPSGVAMLGRLRRLLTEDTASLLLDTRRRYGPIVELSLPGENNAYLFSDPEYIQQVLESNQGNYRKSDVYHNELARIFGQGLLTSEGERWMRQHRLIRPMFRSDTVRSFAELVVEETDAMVQRWAERDEPIELLREMERVTLLIIGKAMFSTDMETHANDIAASLRVMRRSFQRRTSVLPTIPEWVPTPHNRRASAALEELNGIVYDLIEERRGETDKYDDLLSALMAARDEKGERMADEQLRDELMTFLLAGHETTAAALTWTWYLLARNPEIHEELHKRVSGASAGAFSLDGDGPSYVTQCVQEAMRIYPPVPVFSRKAIAGDVIGGYEIPAGSELIMSQYVVHRDPELWSTPTAFRPERFAAGTEMERPRYSYFPFGGGARMCIGRQFALMEAQLVLSRAVARYRLDLQSPTIEPGVSSAVTMVPDEPLEMHITNW
ncbi:MAG TPA: cytochrome P450 [Halococcus sp.]|nr:cytochrome P450 [Halococcus sp.]